MLTPEAKALHMALRCNLLPRIGYGEVITSLQQWLILSIVTNQRFDVVDLILCEIQDVIVDGMTMAK